MDTTYERRPSPSQLDSADVRLSDNGDGTLTLVLELGLWEAVAQAMAGAAPNLAEAVATGEISPADAQDFAEALKLLGGISGRHIGTAAAIRTPGSFVVFP